MAAAAMAFLMLMMAALYIRVIIQPAVEERLYSSIRVARDTAVQFYTCIREGSLRAAADASADQYINALIRKKPG